MVKKTIVLSIEKDILIKVKNKLSKFGGSVSKVVENLLKEWLYKNA